MTGALGDCFTRSGVNESVPIMEGEKQHDMKKQNKTQCGKYRTN